MILLNDVCILFKCDEVDVIMKNCDVVLFLLLVLVIDSIL